MGSESAKALDGFKPSMRRMEGESVPTEVRMREAHGKVLKRAAEIAGYSNDKELAGELGVARSSLSEWFKGDPHGGHPQTWRFQQHPRLGPALLIAQAEVTKDATATVAISVPLPDVKVGT